jgi:hypothetical protein
VKKVVFSVHLALLGLMGQALYAQSLSPQTHEVLQAMAEASSAADVERVASSAIADLDAKILWRDAVAIATSDMGSQPAGHAALTRLLWLALVLEVDADRKPSVVRDESLDELTPADLNALRVATGFPQQSDALTYLLNRRLSLRSKPQGEYSVVRLARKGGGCLVLEYASRPFQDLGPTWSARAFDDKSDPVEAAAEEQGQTRRMDLSRVPGLVLAAKAFRIAGLAPASRRAYAFYVATEAYAKSVIGVGMQAADGGSMGLASWALRRQLLDLLEEQPRDPVLSQLASEMRMKIPTAAFFARAFERAAEFYAAEKGGEPERKLWAAWGEGISLFGAGKLSAVGPAFDGMTPFFGIADGAERYAYILLTFIERLDARERSMLGDLRRVVSAAQDRLTRADLQPAVLADLDMDFSRIMVTIGRSDIGIAHVLDRLRALDFATSPAQRRVESVYLHSLGAFARDLCYDISWTMSPNAGWRLRLTNGFAVQLDFLHNINARRTLTAPGEVVTLESGTPYGMVSPEEDCATVLAAYGVIGESASLSGAVQTSIEFGTSQRAVAIAKWAAAARDRTTPVASIAPYLKVVWAEWFSQQFESLKTQSKHQFVYRPFNATGLAEPKMVRDLKAHPAATEQQRALIDTVLRVRELLEQRYALSPTEPH